MYAGSRVIRLDREARGVVCPEGEHSCGVHVGLVDVHHVPVAEDFDVVVAAEPARVIAPVPNAVVIDVVTGGPIEPGVTEVKLARATVLKLGGAGRYRRT